MTPGLREFILEAPAADGRNGKDPVADLLPAVFDALAQAFTVTTERGAAGSGARRRTWLDTFDCRLWRAGLVLEFEQARRGGRLLLSRAGGTPQADQRVTGWSPRRPSLPADLPAGPVRDRIMVLVSPRALLPVVRAASTVRVIRLLNADGKTVARLVQDHTTVTGAPTPTQAGRPSADTTADLPLRLAVADVRGYPGQARKAAALLVGIPGVSHASQTVFGSALTALGRHPADYSAGVDAEITAQLPASVAVARLLLRLLDTLELNVDGVLRDIDTEFLHDLRVAVRRTRSAIKLLGEVLPADLAAHYAAEFKWLGDLTTPTRDLDVHLLGFDAMAAQLLAASPADLEPFRAFLARCRRRELRRLTAALRGPRFRAVLDDWRKALLRIRDAAGADPYAAGADPYAAGADPGPGRSRRRREATAAALAVAATGRAFRRITAQGRAITPDSPPESLHNLRKRGKELRYLLEFFAPLHDPVGYRKVVGDLKQLQDCLGEFQDSQVQREEIQALAASMLAERSRTQTPVTAATLLAMGEIAAKLAVSQAEARADFARRFAGFAAPASQERVRALLAASAELDGAGR